MSTGKLHVPADLRQGAWRGDEEKSVDSAVWLIRHMCEQLGLSDLGDSDVLDFGCGVKFTQAFVNRGIPVKRYVGVDVNSDMITFLREHVRDPRFEYHHLDAHNALYNPKGQPFSEVIPLPIDGQRFDVICLFSVFTHLAPHDYHIMLKLLRRFAKPGGWLFFTLFIDERTEAGYGLIDQLDKAVRDMPERRRIEPGEEGAQISESGEAFKDLHPRQPLKWAVYSERHARDLITGTGWRAVSLSPPDEYVQHHFVCQPV
jgi:SAM-dependent methyltransferase